MNLSDVDLWGLLPELSDEEKHQRTLAGLADVEAGRAITHGEMMAWVQSSPAEQREMMHAPSLVLSHELMCDQPCWVD